MTQDRVIARERNSVVHQAITRAQSPQRRSAEFVRRFWRTVLHDAIACPHIMEQEVAVRMNYLVPQCSSNRELTTMYHRSRGRFGDRTGVAHRTTDLPEQFRSRLRISCCRRDSINGRSLGSAHEIGELVD